MDTHMIKAIVFDMGGTLYDTPREIVNMTRFILSELGLDQFSDLSDSQILQITKRIDNMFDSRLERNNADPYWLPSFDDSVEYDKLILEKLGVEGDLVRMATRAHQAWEKAYSETKPNFIESCRTHLETLHQRGYRLGIASNRRNDPIPHLESAGIRHLFDVIEYSCVPGYRKPSPFMLLQAAAKLGVNPRRCAYVGDKVEYDVVAAKRAEFLPILIIWCDPKERMNVLDDVVVIEHINKMIEMFRGAGVH